jgi:hypothetical protein
MRGEDPAEQVGGKEQADDLLAAVGHCPDHPQHAAHDIADDAGFLGFADDRLAGRKGPTMGDTVEIRPDPAAGRGADGPMPDRTEVAFRW